MIFSANSTVLEELLSSKSFSLCKCSHFQPCKYLDIFHINWCSIFSIHSMWQKWSSAGRWGVELRSQKKKWERTWTAGCVCQQIIDSNLMAVLGEWIRFEKRTPRLEARENEGGTIGNLLRWSGHRMPSFFENDGWAFNIDSQWCGIAWLCYNHGSMVCFNWFSHEFLLFFAQDISKCFLVRGRFLL